MCTQQRLNQPAYPCCLIRVFIVRMKTLCIFGYSKCAQWRFWSDCANARWSESFCAYLSDGMFSELATHLFVTEPDTANSWTKLLRPPKWSTTSMARRSLGPWKFIRDMGGSSHWGLIMPPGQEANGDNLGSDHLIFMGVRGRDFMKKLTRTR